MTSTTIEAQITYGIDDGSTSGDETAIAIRIGDHVHTYVGEAAEFIIKAIEAEKLKGQIELLDYLRQDAGYGEYTATEYRDAIELRIQSLQQQLDSIEKPESK